jgi:hypothetical protein
LPTLSASSNRHQALRQRWEIPTIEQVMIEERAAAFAKRSIKASAKVAGLKRPPQKQRLPPRLRRANRLQFKREMV